MSAAVCFLPIISSVLSLKVCGFTHIRVTPYFFKSDNTFSSIQSGLPASTVYSQFTFPTAASIFSSSSADNETGVPPPMYTDLRFLIINFAAVISRQSASTYSSRRFSFDIILETKEQYEHLVGQNGMPINKSQLSATV